MWLNIDFMFWFVQFLIETRDRVATADILGASVTHTPDINGKDVYFFHIYLYELIQVCHCYQFDAFSIFFIFIFKNRELVWEVQGGLLGTSHSPFMEVKKHVINGLIDLNCC